MELTFKQRQALTFIEDYIEDEGSAPTLREIGRALGVSVGTAKDHLSALERKGAVTRNGFASRGVRLAAKSASIPILGRVFAGTLHEAVEESEGAVEVEKRYRGPDHFALRVRGDSMVDAGILEGDMVVVRAQPTAEDGDIVVARADGEATVKRLRRRAGRYVLEPANDAYRPIEGPFEIVGRVVSLRREI